MCRPTPQVPRGFDVDVRMLRVDVVCGSERIGSGESRLLGMPISLHTEIPLQVTRSLTAGLTVAMVWMPADNVLPGILAFLGSAFRSQRLSDLLAYQLAPNLSHLIQALQPWRSAVEMGARPPTYVSVAHALLVTPPGTWPSWPSRSPGRRCARTSAVGRCTIC